MKVQEVTHKFQSVWILESICMLCIINVINSIYVLNTVYPSGITFMLQYVMFCLTCSYWGILIWITINITDTTLITNFRVQELYMNEYGLLLSRFIAFIFRTYKIQQNVIILVTCEQDKLGLLQFLNLSVWDSFTSFVFLWETMNVNATLCPEAWMPFQG